MRTLLPLAIAILTVALPVAAELTLPVQIDVGPDDQALTKGFAPLSGQMYEPARGYGWTGSSGLMPCDRHSPEVPTYHRATEVPLYDLVRDQMTLRGPNTLRLDLPDGPCDVALYVGDLSITETRPGLWVSIGERDIVEDLTTYGGQVQELTFPVEVTGGALEITLDGRGPQSYFPFAGIVVRALDQPRGFELTSRTIPEERGTPEDYRRNWAAYLDGLRADWERAKQSLQAAGRWSDDWPARLEELRTAPDYRPCYASGTSLLARMEMLSGEALDGSGLMTIMREVGFDGFTGRDEPLIRAQIAVGMTPLAGGPGLEHLPQSAEGITFIKIVRADGSFDTIEGAYSPWDPAMTEVFRQAYEGYAEIAPQCKLLWIDEPRGAWGAGGVGDYSEPAQAAFAQWAREQGLDPAQGRDGIPTPERSWDFYRFYRWRLTGTAEMVRRFWEPMGIDLPIYPGNGSLGPETMNHNTLWPPALAERGMGAASWMYGGGRASAELLTAVERELDGDTLPFSALWREPDQCVMQSCLVASAGSRSGLHLWQPGTTFFARNRAPWLEAAAEIARMVQGLSGLEHVAQVYLYCPESIVYNDLVEFNREEAGRWKAVQDALQAANLDFRVTLTCDLPADSLLIYAPARAVLNDEEAAALEAYLSAGGALFYASATEPEYPDGSPLQSLRDALAQGEVTRMAEFSAQAVAALARERGLALNPSAVTPGVLSFGFEGDGRRATLWVNTSAQAATETTPFAAKSLITGEALAEGAQFTIPAWRYRVMIAEG